jgi:predicted nucleic acid-binding protein
LTVNVIDASVALPWCFPNEASDYADGALVALDGQTIPVPALWPIEIANAVLVAEQRKRIKQPEILRFVGLLNELTVAMDSPPVADTVSNLLPLGRAKPVLSKELARSSPQQFERHG